MNDTEIAKAVYQLPILQGWHDAFLVNLAKTAGRGQSPGSSITVEDGEIVASSFGHTINVTWRPIFHEGELAFSEYLFSTPWSDESMPLLVLNLERDTGFYEPQAGPPNAHGRDSLVSLANGYLCSLLMERVAGSLFRSPVFAPHKLLPI
jgi:hypothetical protein